MVERLIGRMETREGRLSSGTAPKTPHSFGTML